MRMRTTNRFLLALVVAFSMACTTADDRSTADGASPAYESTFESLSRHEAAPEWFRDSKLGIYFHWGVYSVPAFSTEWYPRLMHLPGHPVWEHHLATYGHPSEFGYHDFAPEFTAEKFDPDE